MSYQRVNWENTPSTATPLSAENLNKMDEGIADVDERLNGIDEDIDNVDVRLNGIDEDIANVDERLTTAEANIKNKIDNTDGSVKTNHIANGAVTGGYQGKIAQNTIDSYNIKAGSITENLIEEGAVTPEKLSGIDTVQMSTDNKTLPVSAYNIIKYINNVSFAIDGQGNILTYSLNSVITDADFGVLDNELNLVRDIWLATNVTTVQNGAFSKFTNLRTVLILNSRGNVTINDTSITEKIQYRNNMSRTLFYELASLVNLHRQKADATQLNEISSQVNNFSSQFNEISRQFNNLLKEAEMISNKVTGADGISDEYVNYPSIHFLNEYYYKKIEAEAIANKVISPQATVTDPTVNYPSISFLRQGYYSKNDAETNANKVAVANGISDEYVNYPSIHFLNSYYYKKNEIDSFFETGAGSLTVSSAYDDYFSQADYTYSRMGNCVMVNFNIITAKEATSSLQYISFTGLPFATDSSIFRRLTTRDKSEIFLDLSGIGNHADFLLHALNGFSKGTSISDSIIYHIKEN